MWRWWWWWWFIHENDPAFALQLDLKAAVLIPEEVSYVFTMRFVLPEIDLRIGQNVDKACSAKPDPGHGHYKDRVQVQGLTILIPFHWLFYTCFVGVSLSF